MRKSTAGAVLGLIGAIILTIMGTIFAFTTGLISDIAGSQATLAVILSWLTFLGGILGIVGASLCFKKARIGGILLFVSFAMAIGFVINYFHDAMKLGGTVIDSTIITMGIFMAIPCILVLVGAILGVAAKLRQPKVVENK